MSLSGYAIAALRHELQEEYKKKPRASKTDDTAQKKDEEEWGNEIDAAVRAEHSAEFEAGKRNIAILEKASIALQLTFYP